MLSLMVFLASLAPSQASSPQQGTKPRNIHAVLEPSIAADKQSLSARRFLTITPAHDRMR